MSSPASDYDEAPVPFRAVRVRGGQGQVFPRAITPSDTPLATLRPWQVEPAQLATPMCARSDPAPESASVVTGMTRPPRPPTDAAPNPSAVGNDRCCPPGSFDGL